ncbi:ATP-binding cassette domain-containing protein [Hoeflea algicola]|uniref:ATP-binding cassette domain-containing protein n=1 Tax=Hoeflea algicola TaxID=2983763 RepID=UPI00226F3998|nr:ATP-binding cassette domain-containing protein [Hoeflea algicola]
MYLLVDDHGDGTLSSRQLKEHTHLAEVPVIDASGLQRGFGGLLAVDGYGLQLARGELVGLIGPNGAGKTTAFNLLTGVLEPSSGTIRIEGRDHTGSPPCHGARRAGPDLPEHSPF